MRTIRLSAAAMLAALASAALLPGANADDAAPAAPPAPAAAEAPAPPAPAPETVVAKVNGTEIRFSDVQDAIGGLPEEYRKLPPQMLFPMLIDQLVDRKAVVMAAQKLGL